MTVTNFNRPTIHSRNCYFELLLHSCQAFNVPAYVLNEMSPVLILVHVAKVEGGHSLAFATVLRMWRCIAYHGAWAQLAACSWAMRGKSGGAFWGLHTVRKTIYTLKILCVT